MTESFLPLLLVPFIITVSLELSTSGAVLRYEVKCFAFGKRATVAISAIIARTVITLMPVVLVMIAIAFIFFAPSILFLSCIFS